MSVIFQKYFAAINDNPQMTFCWLKSGSSDDFYTVLKLPGCDNSYISSQSQENVVVNNKDQVSYDISAKAKT